AWAAFRSPDPRTIETMLRSDTSALPFLAAALARHLEEFPSVRDGLSRSERRMMELARGAPAEIHRAFPAMHDGERAFYITNTMFIDRARDLARSSPPLLELEIMDSEAALPAGTIGLTDAGRDVIDGHADRVRWCGMDRWLGGVRVAGRGPTWRWSAGEARIVRQ
ncbi:MAG TPA: hypothetical protein VEA16_19325, partial [Vicinamibacterales bacterium]|nr:hypothetical protein [Vicinamibacterales bacterium]